MSATSLSSNEGFASSREKHIRLAHVVKGVHAHLRKKYRECGGDYEQVWKKHKEDKEVLTQYADAMHSLATEHWTKRPETRIDWCWDICVSYLYDNGLQKCLEKEARRKMYKSEASEKPSFYIPGCEAESEGNLPIIPMEPCISGSQSESVDFGGRKSTYSESNLSDNFRDTMSGSTNAASSLEEDATANSLEHLDNLELDKEKVYAKYSPVKYNTIPQPFKDRIRLLDVGSCYNPFQQFEEFVAVGIDISPAVESVFQCDFLGLELTEPLQLAADTIDTLIHSLQSPIERLPRQIFHVVVFSLLLEYFPSPYQRWLCCQKAHELLMVNGLLVIITPDSKSQHKNMPMIKSWKIGIESLGFVRWKYIKQEHLHCMAFRKIIKEQPEDDLVSDVGPDNLFIPQDFQDEQEEPSTAIFFGSAPRSDEETAFLKEQFLELPSDFD